MEITNNFYTAENLNKVMAMATEAALAGDFEGMYKMQAILAAYEATLTN